MFTVISLQTTAMLAMQISFMFKYQNGLIVTEVIAHLVLSLDDLEEKTDEIIGIKRRMQRSHFIQHAAQCLAIPTAMT